MSRSESRKRQNWIGARVDDGEYQTVSARAELAGYTSISAYVRDAALGVRAATKVRHAPKGKATRRGRAVNLDMAKLLNENARIGANLNQLAKWANEDRRFPDAAAELTEVLDEVRANQAAIREALGRDR